MLHEIHLKANKIIPMKDIARNLTNFAKKGVDTDFNQIREQTWNQIIQEKLN